MITGDVIFGVGFLVASILVIAGLYWESKMLERQIKKLTPPTNESKIEL